MPYRISALATPAPTAAACRAALHDDPRTELHPCADFVELLGTLHGQGVDACVLAVEAEHGAAVIGELGETVTAMADLGVRLAPVFVVGPSCTTTMQLALANGAADYLSEALCAKQLVVRIDAQLRALKRGGPSALEAGGCELSWADESLRHGTTRVPLTPHEFALASVLFLHAGEAVPTEAFAMRIWGRSSELCRRTLEQHIYRLRRKLERMPLRVRAVYGVGYRLEVVIEADRRRRPRTNAVADPH